MLRLVGGYSDSAARYGDLDEAEADFADLTAMIADRHHLPATASRSTPFGAAKRKGWGWKGAVAGLAIGAIGAHLATNWRMADAGTVHTAALGDVLLRPNSRLDSDFIPLSRPSIPQQPAPSPVLAVPARQPPLPRPPAPAASFGLQQ